MHVWDWSRLGLERCINFSLPSVMECKRFWGLRNLWDHFANWGFLNMNNEPYETFWTTLYYKLMYLLTSLLDSWYFCFCLFIVKQKVNNPFKAIDHWWSGWLFSSVRMMNWGAICSSFSTEIKIKITFFSMPWIIGEMLIFMVIKLLLLCSIKKNN